MLAEMLPEAATARDLTPAEKVKRNARMLRTDLIRVLAREGIGYEVRDKALVAIFQSYLHDVADPSTLGVSTELWVDGFGWGHVWRTFNHPVVMDSVDSYIGRLDSVDDSEVYPWEESALEALRAAAEREVE